MTPSRLLVGTFGSGTLKVIVRTAQELLRLEEAVGALLSPTIKPHCRVAGCRDGQLILMTDSPAWATRLRYQVPALLAGLRRRAPALGLREILVKVSPFAPPVEVGETPRPTMSQGIAALLHDTATSIEDPQLRTALLRLARRGHPPETNQ